MTINLTQTRRRIMKEAYLVKVQTILGTAVTITKKEACELLTILERRNIKPSISFTEIGNGKSVVIIDEKRQNGNSNQTQATP